jgi:hypothetical protein
MSGGKGGSNTQKTEIPDWLKEPAIRNMARAEDAQKIGYMPWQGPDRAAFNPHQKAAMQQNIGASEAFGLSAPGALTPLQGLRAPTTYADGSQGYSGLGLYEQAKAELAAKQPGDVEKYNKLFS